MSSAWGGGRKEFSRDELGDVALDGAGAEERVDDFDAGGGGVADAEFALHTLCRGDAVAGGGDCMAQDCRAGGDDEGDGAGVTRRADVGALHPIFSLAQFSIGGFHVRLR